MSLPRKPKYGEQCNGCGLCCELQLCPVAEVAFKGQSAPCPALVRAEDGSRTFCAFVQAEQAAGLEPMIQNGLGIGLGCGMSDDVIYL